MKSRLCTTSFRAIFPSGEAVVREGSGHRLCPVLENEKVVEPGEDDSSLGYELPRLQPLPLQRSTGGSDHFLDVGSIGATHCDVHLVGRSLSESSREAKPFAHKVSPGQCRVRLMFRLVIWSDFQVVRVSESQQPFLARRTDWRGYPSIAVAGPEEFNEMRRAS